MKYRNFVAQTLIVYLFTITASFAAEYTSPFVPERTFTDRGHNEFTDYVERLDAGQVAFSFRFTGATAPKRFKYSRDFGPYYDELMSYANRTVDVNGSFHISEAIQYGKEILRGRVDYYFSNGRTDPRLRKFTEQGKKEFEDYINSLEKGKASFSMRRSGIKTAHKYEYGEDFQPFYDQLHDLCKVEISKRGSVHINKIIKFAKKVVSDEFSTKTVDGLPDLSSEGESQAWFKEECEFLGHSEGTKEFDECIQELIDFYVD